MHSFVVKEIDTGAKFAIWPVWLLFSLIITLILSINLIVSGSQRAHSLLPRTETRAIDEEDTKSYRVTSVSWMSRQGRVTWKWILSIPYKSIMFWIDVLWSVLWLIYIICECE